jgi:hypothetical protein
MFARSMYRYGFGTAAMFALSRAYEAYPVSPSGYDERGFWVGVRDESKPVRITYGPVRKGRGGKVPRW